MIRFQYGGDVVGMDEVIGGLAEHLGAIVPKGVCDRRRYEGVRSVRGMDADDVTHMLRNEAVALFGFSQKFFRTDPFVDVPDHMNAANESAFGVVNRRNGNMDPAAELLFIDLPDMRQTIFHENAVGAECRRFRCPVDTLVTMFPRYPHQRHTQFVGHGPVNPDDPVIGIQNGNQVRNGVEGSRPFVPGLHQLLYDLFPTGDVMEELYDQLSARESYEP